MRQDAPPVVLAVWPLFSSFPPLRWHNCWCTSWCTCQPPHLPALSTARHQPRLRPASAHLLSERQHQTIWWQAEFTAATPDTTRRSRKQSEHRASSSGVPVTERYADSWEDRQAARQAEFWHRVSRFSVKEQSECVEREWIWEQTTVQQELLKLYLLLLYLYLYLHLILSICLSIYVCMYVSIYRQQSVPVSKLVDIQTRSLYPSTNRKQNIYIKIDQIC